MVSLIVPALIAAFAILQPWVPAYTLFADFVTVAETSTDCCHVYDAAVSNLGILMFIGTAAACMLAATVLLVVRAGNGEVRAALFAGLLSGWLGLDDMFMLHETVFPKLGIAEFTVLLVYVGLAGAYVIDSWRLILRGESWLFLMSIIAFGLSFVLDLFFLAPGTLTDSYEESAKLIGIFAWSGFHFSLFAALLSKRLSVIGA